MSSEPLTRLPRLYLLSPLPPQRNGLADYIAPYLPLLARHFELYAVSHCARAEAARSALAGLAGVHVLDESQFLARQPDRDALIVYNLGNNGDCVWMLDYLHRLPGVVVVHDISLFYLHQLAAAQANASALLGHWVAEDGYQLPDDFSQRDGSIGRTPGLLYQECLMLRRIVASARGLVVHTAYAERRLRGAAQGLGVGPGTARPLARIPHFVLPPPTPDPLRGAELLTRFGIRPGDCLLLVPGFLTGNKMLYEVLAAYHAVQAGCPGLKLVFAGDERPEEYDLTLRIARLWPDGGGPRVTGYLEADELDALLGRADLSFVLRFPTYGESSGLLPRAAMGGGEVVTVDIGAYAEFLSSAVSHVPIGADTVGALSAAMLRVWGRRADAARRAERQADALEGVGLLSPQALLPDWLALLQAAGTGARKPAGGQEP